MDKKTYEDVPEAQPITDDHIIEWIEAMKASIVGKSSAPNRRMCDAIVATIKEKKDTDAKKRKLVDDDDETEDYKFKVTNGRHAGVNTKFRKVEGVVSRQPGGRQWKFRIDDGDNLPFWMEFCIPRDVFK